MMFGRSKLTARDILIWRCALLVAGYGLIFVSAIQVIRGFNGWAVGLVIALALCVAADWLDSRVEFDERRAELSRRRS